MEHKARPPARFSSLRSPKNTTIHPLEYAKTVFIEDDPPGEDALRFFINHMVTNAYWVKLISTVHASFADPGLIVDSGSLKAVWGTPVSGQFLPPARVSQIVRSYVLSFFNKFLKGEDDHLLDGPSAAYPEVEQFMKH